MFVRTSTYNNIYTFTINSILHVLSCAYSDEFYEDKHNAELQRTFLRQKIMMNSVPGAILSKNNDQNNYSHRLFEEPYTGMIGHMPWLYQ